MKENKNKHHKRAESVVNVLRFEPSKLEKERKLNRTQQFFVEAFKKDLSDEDFKGAKKSIKFYFADKLSRGLDKNID